MSAGLRLEADVWSSSIVSATSFLAPSKSLADEAGCPQPAIAAASRSGSERTRGRIGARG